MDAALSYHKVRADFGRHCTFGDPPRPQVLHIASTDEYKEHFVVRQPSVTQLTTTVEMSEHEVRRDRGPAAAAARRSPARARCPPPRSAPNAW